MSDIEEWTLLLQLAATLTIVGIIWFALIVHYPLFSQVERKQFRSYEMGHQGLPTWVVGRPMRTELFTAILLLWWHPDGIPAAFIWMVAQPITIPSTSFADKLVKVTMP